MHTQINIISFKNEGFTSRNHILSFLLKPIYFIILFEDNSKLENGDKENISSKQRSKLWRNLTKKGTREVLYKV